MIKVGITGQAGFMGTHLFNFLGLQEGIERVPFEDAFFDDQSVLERFVKQCDVIVHLAAMNRHGDAQVIYDTNMRLVRQLIEALETTDSRPHVLMSSSTQEERDNPYGKSKKEGREMLAAWAKRADAPFTGLIIPNVYGPFGRPYYNSVVSTFAYQLTHGETPKIEIDASLKLIYINELVEEFLKAIEEGERYRPIAKSGKHGEGEWKRDAYRVAQRLEMKVSDILTMLQGFKASYFEKGIFPELKTRHEINLFNTFRSYIDADHFPVKYKKHTDNRGSFVETVKAGGQGQFSFSTTKPGITRGNHFHIRKVERFAVIQGEAVIRLRKIGTDEVIEYHLNGEEPGYVDMPVWYTHNITNTGDADLYTLFWINEFFDAEDADTFYEQV